MYRTVVFVLFFAVSASAAAEELSYTYLQGSYDVVDVDPLDIDGDGIGFDASFALTNQFYLIGNYQGVGLDFDVDLTRWSAGAGFHAEIGNNLDMIAELSYLNVDADGPVSLANENGILGRVGVRGAVSDAVELQGAARYDDLSEEFSFDAGFLFDLTDSLSVGAFGLWEDEATTYRLAVRLNF